MIKSWSPLWEEWQPPGQPQTHVLIIGVGKYRHLPGGGSRMVDPKHVFDLGQLASPPVSARSFANWVLEQGGYRNDDAPLGSVDLLISEHHATPYTRPDKQVVKIRQATIGNIHKAFKAWLGRCDSHPENVAIFYFCGHGVWIDEGHVLLAEDYGRDPLQPFSSAMNFSKMIRGLRNRRARLQCYFIDACSNFHIDGLHIDDAGAQTFMEITWPEARQEPFLVLWAAAEGNKAYGDDNEVSRFTEALLGCLKGRGCEVLTTHGQWVVSTASLASNIHRVLNSLNENPNVLKQTAEDRNRGYGRIHVRDDPPTLPVIVRLIPQEAIRNARLSLDALGNPNWHPNCQPASECWELEQVPVGPYMLHAYFDPPEYRDVELQFTVLPPGPVPEPIPLQEAR